MFTWTTPPLRSPTHCDTQADHSYCGRVRQRVPHRYSAPHGFRRLEPSLSPTHTVAGVRMQYRDTPSHVPHESLDRTHAAYTPDTTWAVSGYPPDSSRDRDPASVLMPSNQVSTRQRQRTFVHRSSSRSAPDAIRSRLFPRRSRRRSLTNAPRGGLEPPSARRLRRAKQPPSLMQHRSPRDRHRSSSRFPRSLEPALARRGQIRVSHSKWAILTGNTLPLSVASVVGRGALQSGPSVVCATTVGPH